MLPHDDPENTAPSLLGLTGRHVLVAEPSAPARWAQVGRLRNAGARVTEARDGAEALALAHAQRPDLVVAARTLPGLDGEALCEALSEDPSLEGTAVLLLPEGATTPRDPRPDQESILAAAVTALADHLAEPRRTGAAAEGHGAETNVDPSNRENARAQSTVAMHREPANRGPRDLLGIWRLGSGRAHGASKTSGFGLELRVMSRVLGIGFVALLIGTVALILWRQARLPTVDPTGEGASLATDESESRETESLRTDARADQQSVAPRPGPQAVERSGLHAYSGSLRKGVDDALIPGPSQGALEVSGPSDLQVWVDGLDRGTLPLSIVLDEGIHRIRIASGSQSIDRFAFVKEGFTRVLRTVTRPGGFVDAR